MKYLSRLFALVKLPFGLIRNLKYKAEFKYWHIKYASFPHIRGKLDISVPGEFILGEQVSFVSDRRANFVGLIKPCSIRVQKGASLRIGSYSGFSGVSIFCYNKIIIGDYVCCGGNVFIWDTDFHPLNYQDRRKNVKEKIQSAPITIGDDVFLGANSIILKGVTIGDRSVIGAGSVVTKSVPPDEVWGGNPAQFIKKMEIVHLKDKI